MQIKEMFAKKIDREIQGVIIVGQGEDSNVSQELEEYVVTRELQKHFADFYASYKKGIVGTTPKMGVWISGFFGSGKSHFLKILSYLLENRQVSSKKALDYFIDDKKIIDPMVLADMSWPPRPLPMSFCSTLIPRASLRESRIRMPSSMYSSRSSTRCRAFADLSLRLPIWSAVCRRKAAMTSSKPHLRKNMVSLGKCLDRTLTSFRTVL